MTLLSFRHLFAGMALLNLYVALLPHARNEEFALPETLPRDCRAPQRLAEQPDAPEPMI